MIETFKDVFTLVQKTDNIELINKIIALQTDAMGVMEENRTLKDKARALEDALELKGKMQFDKDAYWMGEGRTEKEGPYCSRCFDMDRKPVRMLQRYNDYFACTQCETKVQIPGIKPTRGGPAPVSVRRA